MIATIIFGILIIIGIIIFIDSLHNNDFSTTGLFGFFTVLFIILLFTSLMVGYSWEGDIVEKKRIEYIIENTTPNWDALKEAQEYNKDVMSGNNYWCRFTIEDRSEWLIDIDKYLQRR